MRSFLRAALGWGVLLVVMASCGTDGPPTMDCATVADEVAAMDSSGQDRGWLGAITGFLGFAQDSLTTNDQVLDALRRDVVRLCDDFAALDHVPAQCVRLHVRLPIAVPLRRGNGAILVAFFINSPVTSQIEPL